MNMNSTTEPVSDELLCAYLDGELDAAAAARVAAAIDADPRLAARAVAQRALRAQLKARFDPVLEEAVPLRLQAAAAGRGPRAVAKPRPAWEWGALAASVVLGVLAGAALFRGGGTDPWRLDGDRLLASGRLDRALSESLSGDAGIGLTIRTGDGGVCRSFQFGEGPAGLACRRGGKWVVDVLADSAGGTGGYRPAGSALPESLRLAIESRAIGEPLTRDQEVALRASGWTDDPAATP